MTAKSQPGSAPITLLTDFGYQDPYVGIMKGVILGINPRAILVDLTHGIAPQAVLQGAFALAAAWPFFPLGTVHLAVVDPGVGGRRAPILVEAKGHFFVGPDNGLFSLVLEQCDDARVWKLEAAQYRLESVSATFHGRDIFAPAAAWLTRGISAEKLGRPFPGPRRLVLKAPEVRGNVWCGEVLYVDTFGNMVTNLRVPGSVGQGRPCGWMVEAGGVDIPVGNTYSDVDSGAFVAIHGSFGVLEVAVNGGNASVLLEMATGATVTLRAVGMEGSSA